MDKDNFLKCFHDEVGIDFSLVGEFLIVSYTRDNDYLFAKTNKEKLKYVIRQIGVRKNNFDIDELKKYGITTRTQYIEKKIKEAIKSPVEKFKEIVVEKGDSEKLLINVLKGKGERVYEAYNKIVEENYSLLFKVNNKNLGLYYFVYVNEEKEELIIDFSGSDRSYEDWVINNLKIPFMGVDRDLPLFKEVRKNEIDLIFNKYKDKYTKLPLKVISLGNSLGGALATICHIEICERYESIKSYCISHNGPWITFSLLERYENAINGKYNNIYNFINENDMLNIVVLSYIEKNLNLPQLYHLGNTYMFTSSDPIEDENGMMFFNFLKGHQDFEVFENCSISSEPIEYYKDKYRDRVLSEFLNVMPTEILNILNGKEVKNRLFKVHSKNKQLKSENFEFLKSVTFSQDDTTSKYAQILEWLLGKLISHINTLYNNEELEGISIILDDIICDGDILRNKKKTINFEVLISYILTMLIIYYKEQNDEKNYTNIFKMVNLLSIGNKIYETTKNLLGRVNIEMTNVKLIEINTEGIINKMEEIKVDISEKLKTLVKNNEENV